MPRARLGLAHALACASWGAAAVLVASQPIAPASLALGGAVAAGTAAIGVLLPLRARARSVVVGALVLSLVAVVAVAVASLLAGELHTAVLVAPLAAAAGMHARAMSAAGAADPSLAPRVRLAPSLLGLAGGAALVAAAAALGQPALVVLAVVALLELAALALLVRPAADVEPESAPAATGSAPPARLLPLLAVAVAGAAAVVALRPALSALGADEPQPAGPAALTLAIGGLAGPPLARLVARLGLGRGGALLATLAGAAALVAPIARPGALDVLSAAVLGIGLAAAVALAELARRSGVTFAPRAVTLLLLAAALGAAIAALLLTSVPLPDVVLGASIACLVAGLGAWAPAPRERVA
ncbi:hypothetical protein [Agrococcus jenensis]|uniref:Uncharacterized protein n=1 Tax=Agrococcus jenensis TaxID=46353 RepID=A0A3N2AQR9_9MICO|nr:hypothetical protein [Agrococcus jenensis]ROR65245.1 hypothetical protein EDD26_0610 [Agrococcus jenensis]